MRTRSTLFVTFLAAVASLLAAAAAAGDDRGTLLDRIDGLVTASACSSARWPATA